MNSDSTNHPQDNPLSTSSPRQNQTKRDSSGRTSLLSDLANSAPCSSGQGPRTPGDDDGSPRGRRQEHLGDLDYDRQHQDANNCGCHRCIRELAITKLEPMTPGRELSANFRLCVKRLKIYHSTALKSHHSGCLCRTHLEKLKYKLAKNQEQSKGRLRNKTPPKQNDPTEDPSKNPEPSKMREGTSGKVDPRTGLPPPITPVTENAERKGGRKQDENNQRQNIAVITSR